MSVVVNSIRIPVHDDDAIVITKTMISRQERADVKLLIQYVKLVRKKRQLRNEKVGRILRKFGYEKMLTIVISGVSFGVSQKKSKFIGYTSKYGKLVTTTIFYYVSIVAASDTAAALADSANSL